MSFVSLTLMKNHYKVVAVVGIFCLSGLGLRGAPREHRSHLSDDLLSHVGRKTSARARVLVHGDAATIDALAARYHLQVVRRLERAAVVAANSAEIEALGSDDAVDHLSGDLPVKTWMTVSSQATAADQVRAGTSGLLGIGGIPGVPGPSVGVAVIDSGHSAAMAVPNRVLAHVRLAAVDSRPADANEPCKP